ncbi:hypothetical protein H0H81_006505 [Sphagnurus paluster]|uniref:NmrA-like domain-containing protein n=1 Tax=Sphagnurus paluster TaxID=117069 RepID=A0A9P7K6K0_9AGAR|nr:hypothetical protein H0H81_006505 [Sphagnurus paluster]
MSQKILLVTGATGKQGRALINALRADVAETEANPGTSQFHILALTRKAGSPAARRLAEEKNVEVVEGNLDDPQSLRKVFEDAKSKGGVWGVFCVLAFPGLGVSGDDEEKQGKTVADLALEFGVSSFIFSSYERGGESHDDHVTLDHLAKVRIERHVKDLGTKGLSWTILRPGFFMENFDGAIGAIAAGVLKAGLKDTTSLRLIAVDDIGHVAAEVFKNPEAYLSKVIVVVGDTITTGQMEAAYKTATGRSLPSIPKILGRALISINRHTKALITEIERVHRISADHENEDGDVAVTEVYPNMTTFGAWAAQSRKDENHNPNWNHVSIGRLITGRQ